MNFKGLIALFLGIIVLGTSAGAEGILRERIKERLAERRAEAANSANTDATAGNVTDDAAVPATTEGGKGSIRQRLEDGAGRDVTQSQFGGRLKEKLAARKGGAGGGEKVTINGLNVAVWRPDGAEHAPLVVFSHGFNGCNTQSKFLMQALADDGYVVVAPNHKDASCGGGGAHKPQESFKNPEAWNDNTYADRRNDIMSLVNGLKSDPSWNRQIDWSRVALAGHSLGGYTVLGLAGGWDSWHMSGIRAVLALSPVCTPYLSHDTLGGISEPIMYQGGTRDIGVTPSVKKPGGCHDKTPSPNYFIEFKKAGHFAFTDLVPEFQADINYYSLAFLDAYVKGDRSALNNLSKKLPSVSDMKSK